jgi:hypothetical protein
MATRRTRSLSTKVTDVEYELAANAAAPLTISEWARKMLLQAVRPDPMVTALLAELLALRTILLNLHFALAEGKTVTADFMNALIERADHDKWKKVDDRLAAIRTRTEWTSR